MSEERRKTFDKKKCEKPVAGWTRSFEKNADKFDKEDMSDQFRKKNQTLDALTESLGCQNYFHKMRWPWFFYEYGGLKHPLEVDRYYHERKIAIDFGKVAEKFVLAKTKALDENGIKYILLQDANDLKALALGMT